MILLIVIILLLLLGYGIYRVATGNKALYRRWIGKQVPLWEYKNIITVQQGEAILSEYNAKRAKPAKRIDAIKAILLIGAIFVGLGVIFLVGANWHKIPLAIRTFGLLFVSVATLCSGYYYSYKEEGYRFLGKNLFFLSAILWGASLILICQIYNVPASDNWIIMILWALPILPMAHFFENRYTFMLASVLLIAWYFMYSISMDRPNYWYPVLVFGALIPMSGDFKPGLIMNTLFVLIAAYYCPFGKHEWLALFIGVFLFAQYFFKGKEPVYIYAATLSLAAWQITFGIARDISNYFALVPLAAVFVVSYRERLTLNLFISICAFILWFHQIFLRIFKTLRLYLWDYNNYGDAVVNRNSAFSCGTFSP
ncbi:MAG: hypothetical protein BWY26_01495 [Elusimicrobia bacterium ADurb.Bin231]|nr:MAG: hypothetical protein BWY26_01495 [Elusimicrobia bacterium ADurb.Bin231]